MWRVPHLDWARGKKKKWLGGRLGHRVGKLCCVTDATSSLRDFLACSRENRLYFHLDAGLLI
jgi:hypothetical protein